MATITLKNIPAGLYERLKRHAKLRRRSLNSEIISRLETSVGDVMDPEEIRLRARLFREKIRGQLSPEEIENAINEGRPTSNEID
ncbi:MAG: FitA-like ribbon-helix-helix domain-containing protein [Bacteroidota bacterium]